MQQFQPYVNPQISTIQRASVPTITSLPGLPSSGAYPSASISSGLAPFPSSLPSTSMVSGQMPQYSAPAPVTAMTAPAPMSIAAPSLAMPTVMPAGATPLGVGEVKKVEPGTKVLTSPVSVSSSRGIPLGASKVEGGAVKVTSGYGSREQVLESKVKELELLLSSKEQTIQELERELASAKGSAYGRKENGANKARSPGRTGNGFRKVSSSKPANRYTANDQDDPIDVRLEEFYNSIGSAIPFRRINRGFYRFGDTIVEVDIINHKLMARTEDGWNRGKFGPVEKFLMYYENIEREKAGILPES